MDYVGELIQIGENKRLVAFLLDSDVDVDSLTKRSENGRMNAEIRFDDMRRISAKQRRKTYALIRDIAEFTGYIPEECKEIMKWYFMADTGYDYFSLSNVDMTTAKEFISWLIEFCLHHGIQLHEEAWRLAEDIQRYVYYCLANRICAVTGEHENVHIHHLTGSRVGMGRNRETISHEGLEIIPLRADIHQLFHQYGDEKMLIKYHLVGIKADKKVLKELGMKVIEKEEDIEIVYEEVA
jgi:hypothetical protein